MDVQRPAVLIDNAAGNVFLGASHIVVTRLVIPSRFATARVIAQVDGRFTVHTQSSDAAIIELLAMTMEVVKNCIRFWEFFWGFAFTTFRNR